jgi:hypothetical protein
MVADMSLDDDAGLEKWVCTVKDYREIAGMIIPVKADATWKPASGDFTYIDIDITDIEYDNPAKY